MDTPQALEAMQWYENLFNRERMMHPIAGADRTFLDGKVAMIGRTYFNYKTAILPNVGDKFKWDGTMMPKHAKTGKRGGMFAGDCPRHQPRRQVARSGLRAAQVGHGQGVRRRPRPADQGLHHPRGAPGRLRRRAHPERPAVHPPDAEGAAELGDPDQGALGQRPTTSARRRWRGPRPGRPRSPPARPRPSRPTCASSTGRCR